jgi:ABC-2 type transport system ATP-binding protein
MKATIRERAAAGAAVIVSSHLLSLVEEICHRVLILVRGRKREEGSLAELAARFPELAEGARLEDLFLRATGPEESTETEASAEGSGATP